MRHRCRRTTPSRLSCDAYNKGQRVVRRQVTGLARRTRERVGVGLRTAGCTCYLRSRCTRSISISGAVSILIAGRPIILMLMACQLLHGEGRGPHSAGHIRSCPRRQRLLLGSGRPHDVRQSVVRWQAAGLSRRSRQTVRVGLRSARKKRRCVCVTILRIGLVYAGTVGRKHKFLHRMMMYRQLFPCNGRSADSAGQTFSTAAMRQKNKEIRYGKSHRCPC